MADKKICDSCGKSPAEMIEVTVALWSVVEAGQPTFSSLAADACESCQEDVIDSLAISCREILREQVPFHREMSKASHERDEAQERLNDISPTLRTVEESGSDVPEDIAAESDKILGQIRDAEARRITAMQEGTEAQDKAVKQAMESLKK